jgi:hypothetical protein
VHRIAKCLHKPPPFAEPTLAHRQFFSLSARETKFEGALTVYPTLSRSCAPGCVPCSPDFKILRAPSSLLKFIIIISTQEIYFRSRFQKIMISWIFFSKFSPFLYLEFSPSPLPTWANRVRFLLSLFGGKWCDRLRSTSLKSPLF